MEGLTFDAERHEYRYRGAVVPSVTQILHPLSVLEYFNVEAAVLHRAAELGKAVHKMIELDVRNDLDVSSLSDELQPYYTAWRNFLATSGFVCMLSECKVFHSRYHYAGTLDLAGKLGEKYAVIDAKRTAMVPRTTGPQTAAYRDALAEMRGDPPWREADRYALHFTADGEWKLIPFREAADLRVFLARLTLHQWENQR